MTKKYTTNVYKHNLFNFFYNNLTNLYKHNFFTLITTRNKLNKTKSRKIAHETKGNNNKITKSRTQTKQQNDTESDSKTQRICSKCNRKRGQSDSSVSAT